VNWFTPLDERRILVRAALLYALRASLQTFRNEMADDGNVWLAAICVGIVAFCLLTGSGL
jgi:hypothetical protein